MSALDDQVRSFSPARIEQDLLWLMQQRIPRIKLVDRTFNYDAVRARRIWSFILEHNQGSHFHFEVGAHLLDETSLKLLETVPEGTFQFEIGVQSTLPATLDAIGRNASLERLERSVRRLRAKGNIHLHLDLIAGLPGEGYRDFLASVDRVAALAPHHLQIEPVKLLPGSPLRQQAAKLGIRFDPHPPYTVLATADLDFAELERLRGLSRLFDLTFNSGRFVGFLEGLQAACGTLAGGLERLEAFWRERGLFRHPLSQRGVFEQVWGFVQAEFVGERREELRERLARDYAGNERVVPESAPAFFDMQLDGEETRKVKARVREETEGVRGKGIKLQHFAAVFCRLPGVEGRSVRLFLYLTETGKGMTVREMTI
jgi:anaerobic magnesium-protoporphyrin IX monomethyl ester cyclase